MKFGTVIVDPPWPYGRGPASSGFVSYNVLSVDDLCALPVGEVVDGYCFLWVAKMFLTNEAGFQVMRAWGFVPRSWLIWHKTTGSGVGSWFKSDVEMVLVGSKPDASFVRSRETDFFESQRLGHSVKPDYVHLLVERHYPAPYLELFGRRARRGWTVLGDEAPGDGRDIRKSLTLLL